jgi:hypothetical protein
MYHNIPFGRKEYATALSSEKRSEVAVNKFIPSINLK